MLGSEWRAKSAGRGYIETLQKLWPQARAWRLLETCLDWFSAAGFRNLDLNCQRFINNINRLSDLVAQFLRPFDRVRLEMRTRRLGPEGPSVSAIGLGGMLLSITGRPPSDQAHRVIRSALDHGITLFDTADAYCMDEHEMGHNERIMALGLEGQRERVTVMTTVGCRRPGGAWTVDSDPAYLTEAVHRCLKNQGVETLDLVSLYSPDFRVPYEDSVGALARLKEQGKVKYVGVCNVDMETLKKAESVTPIQAVQNRWNPQARQSEKEGIIEYTAEKQIAFVGYAPFGGTLGAPTLTTLGKLSDQARRRRLSPYQLVLAWMTNKSPNIFVVPGARRAESVEDSTGAGTVEFDADAVRAVENTLPQP